MSGFYLLMEHVHYCPQGALIPCCYYPSSNPIIKRSEILFKFVSHNQDNVSMTSYHLKPLIEDEAVSNRNIYH